MTTTIRKWASGDRVVHSSKPEWGVGTISAAIGTTQDGRSCQSLTVRFERAGLKTLSTAYAHLIPANEAPTLPPVPEPFAPAPSPKTTSAHSGSGGNSSPPPPKPLDADDLEFLARLNGGMPSEIKDKMAKLPDPATDPFSTPVARLKATLATFRFTPTGASLLDWAATQSGLSDPLSRFNRHELEAFFQQFVVVRDGHLRKLIFEMKKTDPQGVAAAVATAPPGAQQALRRLDAWR